MDIKQVISQMTLEEKASLCSGLDFWHTKGVERLGIPPVMVSDGPHGLRVELGACGVAALAQVLAVGARMHPYEEVQQFVEVFVHTRFTDEQRHARRIRMIEGYEETGEVPSALAHDR